MGKFEKLLIVHLKQQQNLYTINNNKNPGSSSNIEAFLRMRYDSKWWW